jgi:hypothetical protein
MYTMYLLTLKIGLQLFPGIPHSPWPRINLTINCMVPTCQCWSKHFGLYLLKNKNMGLSLFWSYTCYCRIGPMPSSPDLNRHDASFTATRPNHKTLVKDLSYFSDQYTTILTLGGERPMDKVRSRHRRMHPPQVHFPCRMLHSFNTAYSSNNERGRGFDSRARPVITYRCMPHFFFYKSALLNQEDTSKKLCLQMYIQV